MKTFLPPLIILTIMLIYLTGNYAFGQKSEENTLQVFKLSEKIEETLSTHNSINGNSASSLNQLINESNPTLVISKGKFSYWGGDIPLIAAIDAQSVEYLYKEHRDFENVQLIRIILDKPSQLNEGLKLNKLTHFKDLSYILIVAAYELCPENNTSCETAMIKNMISDFSEKTDFLIIYQTVHHQ